ncbi:plexin-B3 isoform X5 [Peromyscus maniculatus bairdii]|uniref:plexin-B3 isoform X5 n=1 Tax=Peromyscus maniculatus bairdii TaxID=230844 RepID=UPI001C2E0224|nr:plexin-B3 isoform X6 [Peromyscus maniculatus bairdii]
MVAPVMAPWPLFSLHLLLLFLLLLPLTRAHRFSVHNTSLNHLVLEPGQGTLYVGAVNHLFQLSPELKMEAVAVTGPVIDSPDCVPFHDLAECPQAQLTDNANQLLLVSSRAQELVACGQVRQGVCEKRSLGDVTQVLYQAEDPGDGQFVAANTPGVTTVGLVVPLPGRDLLLVARGLAGKLSAGVPPLTVRQLAGPQPFSSEGLGRLVVGDFSDYNNSYVGAFSDTHFAYFVFRRRGARAQAEYRSYVARVCLGDVNLYSYVEVPLACHGQGLIQAAFLAPDTLLGAFAAGTSQAQAALCAFPLADLDKSMEQARRLCYTTGGQGPSGMEEATVEYGVTSRCITLPPDSPESYPCGDEHTPSPIAGRQPLEAQPLLQLGQPISAVAALQADGHTIAFLGDTQGQLHKVFLNSSQSQIYHSQQVGPPGSAISPDLLVDNSGNHLYVLTAQQVDRILVAACPQFPNCTTCLQARDPLCGWCILQGRCTRRGECGRAAQPNQWLWSYEDNYCLHIQSLLPAQHPRQEQGQVTLSVPRLPTLAMDEYFHCAFGDYDSLAHVEGPHVVCVTPPGDQVPPNPPGSDHVTLPLALMFEDVVVAATTFSFYDCSAVQALEVAAPCRTCVGSLWRCHWCPQSSHCVYSEHCPEGEKTVYSAQEVDIQVRGPGACPQVEGLASPQLVPVGWESHLALHIQNLHYFRGLPALYYCWLELPGKLQKLPAFLEETSKDSGLIHCQAQQFHPSMSQRELPVPIYVTRGEIQRLDNAHDLHVTLYDCAVGHPDCSHCQAANGSLSCLWCGDGQPSCRYGPLCPPDTVEQLCPTPTIDVIEPLTGPPEGGLAITILGSNLGQAFTDVQNAVTVAGQPCNPEASLYRISARIVCVISPAPNGTAGPVQVAIKSRPPGISTQHFIYQCSTLCSVNSSSLLLCHSPAVPDGAIPKRVFFALDNMQVDFASASGGQGFLYQPNPRLVPLSHEGLTHPYRLKPGHVLDVEGEGLNLGISKEEVRVHIGDGECLVKTLTLTHLYCEPPHHAPQPANGSGTLPQFVVQMGNVRLALGPVQYEAEPTMSTFPVEAQVGLGLGATVLIAAVLLLTLMYRHKSKQALRDYQKVLVQLENLETGVGDQCRKEFTDLMTEMTDLTSDLEASGIPFLDYRTYAERAFFPGHGGCPLQPELEGPGEEDRCATMHQGLTQLSNLLNSKLFLLTLIHTLEEQPNFSQRDRCHVASLLSLALHSKLEYLTDILRTLLGDLAAHYVHRNPKLMLRRTETMVEKLLTNWLSICLYDFLKEVAGEPLYMLFRAIKYQVDKGPVDAVTGKAKRTLNDSHLLREDVEFRPLTLMALVGPESCGVAGNSEVQRMPARVLDIDTITQVKEKMLDQVYKGTPFSQRPSVHSLDLEWRSGLAGHLTLSDEDLTSVTQNHWKRLNTLQHYKVPDGATVVLIPQLHNGDTVSQRLGQTGCPSGENIPMLEDGEEGGVRLWHLVKATEESEGAKVRHSSLRERERERAGAKAIPEIYLTRLLSMKRTLQKFVDDTFQAILSVNRPVPIAVKYLFDFLDELAEKHGIEDPETLHIWKTNSLLLRFWVNALKNPQLIFDVRVSDNEDAILAVIAQTFIDSCMVSEHKVGRDSPVNKLLYAREIPRYKQMVEKYYADIHQSSPASYQEMNSALAELSGNYTSAPHCLEALRELYNHIHRYYDQALVEMEKGLDSPGLMGRGVGFQAGTLYCPDRLSVPWKRTPWPRRCSWLAACSRSLPWWRTK